MEVVGALFLILMIVCPWYYFDQLPEVIPTHFNISGKPDGFGSKNTIWTLSLIGSALYVGLSILNLFPNKFNYLTEINQENSEKQYRLSTTLMRRIKLLIIVCFFYIEYGTIQVAIYNAEGLNAYFLPIFLIANLAVLGDYFYRVFRS